MTIQLANKSTWLSTDTIESKADRLLSEYEQRFGMISSPPVPVEKLVEKHLGLVLEWSSISQHSGKPILAYIDPRDPMVIHLNENQRNLFIKLIGPYTFTIAHETGHWALHIPHGEERQMCLFDTEVGKRVLCRGQTELGFDRQEWQANRFAAALMMPEKLIRDYARQSDIYHWSNLYTMAEDFGASISSLRYRLVELKMLYVADDKSIYRSREEYFGQVRIV